MASSPTDRVQAALRDVGLDLAGSPESSVERREAARVAWQLRQRGAHAIGLVPADEGVAVAPIALLVGRALMQLSARAVGLVDAAGGWPCAPALLAAAPEGSPTVTSWILERLALLSPRTFGPGTALEGLRGMLADGRERYEVLLVDLTGFQRLGELEAASALLDAVLLVARGGHTTHRQVRRWRRAVPDGRDLGVLLTGL